MSDDQKVATNIWGELWRPTLRTFLSSCHTGFLHACRVDLWKRRVNILLRQDEISEFQVNEAFQSMTIGSLLSRNNFPLEKSAAIHDFTTLFNGPRPPPPNDVFPLFRPALFIPLVQPLQEVDCTSDLEVDVIRI